jgi:hypothetical protein
MSLFFLATPIRGVGLCVLCFSLLSAHAATIFEPIQEVRSVNIFGRIKAYNGDTQDQSSSTFDEKVFGDPNNPEVIRLGMDLQLPGSGVDGQGIAIQSMTGYGSGFSFEGLADVNVSGYSTPPVQAEGEGLSLINFNYQFRVSERQEIQLDMSSQIGLNLDDDFLFSFRDERGNYVWAAVGIVGDDGNPTRTFSKRLVLPAGNYTIDAQIAARSRLLGNSSSAGRTWAKFAVSAVPEPSSLSLGMIGLMIIGPICFRSRLLSRRA